MSYDNNYKISNMIFIEMWMHMKVIAFVKYTAYHKMY